ncbi:Gfo/Idh/MocA family protein [Clostridium butyricum]|uniref:Gfo/Idh/MocA family protein n=1 Tax=Clostridium butyricum TaxID=1492 RepID=UPI0006A7612E|nr:Gfo/Idh/MocA family oxidoreductase [Clostridium butyricum]
MKCALIGFGYWGKIVKKYLENSTLFTLEYIYSPSLKNGISLEKIYKDKEIKCVFICTPINTHFELSKKCLEHNKHVFCEKPLTKTREQLIELIRIANVNNLCIYTNYIYTQSRSIQYIKNNLWKIGEIKYIKSEIKQFGNFYKEDNVYDVISVHMISAIMYILGVENVKFDIVNNWVINKDKKNNILNSIIEFNINNINGIIESSLLSNDKVRKIEFLGEKGKISFDMLSQNTIREIIIESENVDYGAIKKHENQVYFDEGNNLEYSLEYFYKNIHNFKKENRELSLSVTEILEKINLTNKNRGDKNGI